MVALERQRAFTSFISSRPYPKYSPDYVASLDVEERDSFTSSREVSFNQLRYTSDAKGVETLAIAYHSSGANQLTFASQPGLQIHLRRKGTGVYSVDHSKAVAGATTEMQVYCSPRIWHKNVFEKPDTLSQSLVYGLSPEFAKSCLGRHVDRIYQKASLNVFHFRLPIRARQLNYLDEVFDFEKDCISEIRRNARLLDILAESLEGFRDTFLEGKSLQNLHPNDIGRIHEAEKNIWNDLAGYENISKLASESGMSPSKFKSVFQQVTGSSVGNYVRAARMRVAAKLLDENFRVSEVASRIGYVHFGHFARTFQDTYNMTPSQYRSLNSREKH
jgi:AraC-like DNA-binding protein